MKKPLGKRVATTQVSPSGMAAASQAVPGEFDSRHLLQKDKRPFLWGVFLFGGTPTIDESRGWSREWERALCLIGAGQQ